MGFTFNKISIIFLALLVFVTPFIVYINSLDNGFLAGDEEEIILRNAYLQDWKYLPKFFTENYKGGAGTISNFWRPFQVLTYSVIVHTVGVRPLPFHLASILFHSLCGVFLYLLFLKLFDKKVPLLTIAFLALLWLVQPIHGEELAVSSGLASPTHLFWMLLGLFAFSLFEEKRKLRWLFLSLAGFILSLCSKESAIIFPGLLLGMHIAGIKGGIFKKLKLKEFAYQHIFFWIIALVYVIARMSVLNFGNTLNFYNESNVFTENLLYRIYTLFTVLAHGLRIIFVPIGLHPERSWPVFTSFFSKEVFSSFLILSIIVILAIINWKKRPIVTFGIFWFFFSYLPMSNLVAKINALVWDHWFYTPSVGVFLSLGFLFSYEPVRQSKLAHRILLYLLVFGTIIFSVLTFSRNKNWKDTETVSRFILSYEANSAKTWNNLAMALVDRGETEEAISSYLKAIELSDIYPQSHHNLANAYLGLGKYESAEREYLKALRMDNRFYYSYLGLGKLYLSKGDKKKAAMYFKKALEIYPYLSQGIIDFIESTDNETH